MWKISYLLLPMLFMFDFPRDKFARAEPIRADAVLVTRDDDQNHRQETRGRMENKEELTYHGMNDEQENSSELVGRWRNNGEALEPKWRDGDTVPLLPFSQLSRYSRDKIDSDDEDYYARQMPWYRQANDREDVLRSRGNVRLFYPDYGDYESIENARGYRTRDEDSSRKRNSRPLTGQTADNSRQAIKDAPSIAESRDRTSSRYREAFQIHTNDYEHELDDEEYLKPRPRKRRPPQNYEFALAKNETWANDRKLESNSNSQLKENPTESDSRDAQFLQNAMELKSLLKMQQEEGLSLSELLQRRNLTLNDLLRGKADVINALRSKDSNEGEDYIEEASKMLSSSFAKVSTTRKPQWSEDPVNSQKKEELGIPIIPMDSSFVGSLGSSNRAEIDSGARNATTGKSILATLGPPRTRATPLAPAMITTSLPLPVATNSMELLLSDSVGKLANGGEIAAESLDEDEIMEFSDFTDYKNGRSSVSPVWLMVKNQEDDEFAVKGAKNDDRGSTLSIEQILSPTERSRLMKNLSAVSEGNERPKVDKTLLSKEDYSVSSEYQDDGPIYRNLEHNTQVVAPLDEVGTSKSAIRNVESALDAVSNDDGSITERHQTLPKSELEEASTNYPIKNHQSENVTEKKSYDEVVSEVEPEARAEIFELFASGSAGKRLERLLKSRNMSLEELIALRQRGSSKVHLAEVSRLKARKPNNEDRNSSEVDSERGESHEEFEQKSVGDEGEATSSGNENYQRGIDNSRSFKDSTLNPLNFVQSKENAPKGMQSNSDEVENEESVLETRSEENEEKEKIKENHRAVQIVDILTTFGSLPFAKDIQRNFADEYNPGRRKLPEQNDDLDIVFAKDKAKTRANETSSDIQSGYVKEIVQHEPNSIDIQTVYSETNSDLSEVETKNEKGKTLSKVKPSIIASGAILGVTIVVFLAIFIVCRIRQKQKYRYRNTFSRAVFQGPMLAARKLSNSSSLSTVMVNVVATSTTKRPERNEIQEPVEDTDPKSDIENDSLDANDSWETIPDYMK